MKRLRGLSGIAERWTLHDLRRTVRSGLSGLRVDGSHRIGSDIAERVLGHVVGGVRGIYDRYEYLDEKREALDLGRSGYAISSNSPLENVSELLRRAF
jgi:integrase